MTVIIGIDPHKASHAACAIDNNEHELARAVGAGRATSARAAVGLGATVRVRDGGRSSPLAGSAICSPSSSSARANAWSMCRRRCRRGCGCSASGRSNKNDPNDARAVAIAALRAPSLGGGATRGSRHGVAAVGQGASRRGPGPQPGVLSAARAGRASWSRAGSAKKSLFHRPKRSSRRSSRPARRNVSDSSSRTSSSTRSARSTPS